MKDGKNMAGKKFTWGLKHTIISAVAVLAIVGGFAIYQATVVAPAKSTVSQQAACQAFAEIVKEASAKASLSDGVGFLIKGAAGAAKIADQGKDLARELKELGDLKLADIDLESADAAVQFGAKIQLINELCTAEFSSESPSPAAS